MPASVAYLFDRITVNPRQCGDRPCIRGMRIRVIDILELLAAGLSFEKVLEELPDLELEAFLFFIEIAIHIFPLYPLKYKFTTKTQISSISSVLNHFLRKS